MARRIAVSIVLLSCIALGFANAQQIETRESVLIGPGDLLQVTVLREPELEQKTRVRDSGEITLPLIGIVSVRGLTPAEAAARIAQGYLKGEFLRHPEVSVSIEEFATQTVSVLGQVAHPGIFTITAPRRLLDVLSMAGGLTETADRHIALERGGAWGTRVSVFLPNKAESDFSADVAVHPGDTIIVPKAGIVYVLGDVGRPGGYVMQDDSALSVLQAVALAAGSNKTAGEKHARLIRREKGAYSEQEIPLRAIEKGKKPDMQLQADDILYIPFSMGRNFAVGATGIAASASSALIYAGH